MSGNAAPPKAELVWKGRPEIGILLALYGIMALVAIVILLTLEFYASLSTRIGSSVFPSSVTLGRTVVPYPVEIATAIFILLVYAGKALQYAMIRVRNKYELYSDGLYLNQGLVNLQNTYVAPMSFSDARLVMTWPMRIVKRSLIIVDTNDGRHFRLLYIKNGLEVQSMIRRTLGHPPVRLS